MESSTLQSALPHYIFKPGKISENYELITNVFSKCTEEVGGKFHVAYSFKTNAFSGVVKKVKELGALAEVVSPYEYEIAKAAGFSPAEIVYNGVCKDRETFLECACGGGRVNLDNSEDLQIALDWFEKSGEPLKVGLRISFDIGNKIKSHFGVPVESELFQKILRLDREGKILVVGLHCHFTLGKDVEFWERRVSGMKKQMPLFEHLEYVDLGGNMYAACQKKLLEEYAGAISALFTERKLDLILETGTPLVTEAFDVMSHVTHIKEGFIFVDVCQKDVGLSAAQDECRIKLVPQESATGSSVSQRQYLENYTIVGSTCLENDILKKSFCGKVAVGDRILFQNCGAYSLAWSNNFILPKLPIIQK